ncbi:hypothetical protein ABZY44_15135 [Streptomyces sp. NPDC006544]|uniref:hypothetical protein n=1 Tax=Streptomyces sp. NPDC006544 TaxID=3154583 RepID=UPI0033AB1101
MTALLKLYPAAYRREFGEEIADAYHEATAGAGRPARMREAVDVVGHALRMRLGLGSAGRAGRLVAAVAPFAVVAVGVNAMLWARLTVPAFEIGHLVDEVGLVVVATAAGMATVLGSVLALTGRPAAGAWTMLAGTAAAFGAQALRTGFGPEFAVIVSGPPLLLALVAVLCPSDLRPAPRPRTAAGVAAVLAGAAVLAVASRVWPFPYGLDTALPVAGGLVLAGRQAFARLRSAPAVLLAGLSLAVVCMSTGLLGADPLVLPLLLGLLPAASAAVSVYRRRGGSTPSA